MTLSAPTMPVFVISLILAILAALVGFGGVSIPMLSGNALALAIAAYVVLLLGNLVKGL